MTFDIPAPFPFRQRRRERPRRLVRQLEAARQRRGQDTRQQPDVHGHRCPPRPEAAGQRPVCDLAGVEVQRHLERPLEGQDRVGPGRLVEVGGHPVKPHPLGAGQHLEPARRDQPVHVRLPLVALSRA
jgi:hypothetical protein